MDKVNVSFYNDSFVAGVPSRHRRRNVITRVVSSVGRSHSNLFLRRAEYIFVKTMAVNIASYNREQTKTRMFRLNVGKSFTRERY